ncbi:MAG: dTMP kinase [Chitinispirillaceae bacterium]|jgi:dTMP kinase
MRGLFIVFDGIDGCGKSTQLTLAAERLKRDGYPIVMTREPGGTAISEKIRSIVLSHDNKEMVSECELLLYAAARAQHVHEKIEPALEQGMMVLCDRFDSATIAYQGFGRNISLSLLEAINTVAVGRLQPDLTFIFDISITAAFSRLSAMKKSHDRLESSGRSFFSRVAEGYRTIALKNPAKIVLLDGESAIEELGEMVYKKIKETIVTV